MQLHDTYKKECYQYIIKGFWFDHAMHPCPAHGENGMSHQKETASIGKQPNNRILSPIIM